MERAWEDVFGIGLWGIRGKRPGVCEIVIGLLCLLHWVWVGGGTYRHSSCLKGQAALCDCWDDEGRAKIDSVLSARSGSISLQAR